MLYSICRQKVAKYLQNVRGGDEMTNKILFDEKKKELGFTYTKIAEKAGLSRQGMWKKLLNIHQFKPDEIEKISELFSLDLAAKDAIFFAREGD
jgi:DNA-binding phage protein